MKEPGLGRNKSLPRPIKGFRLDATLKVMREATGEVSECKVSARAAKKR